jgi:hypothetical protein
MHLVLEGSHMDLVLEGSHMDLGFEGSHMDLELEEEPEEYNPFQPHIVTGPSQI